MADVIDIAIRKIDDLKTSINEVLKMTFQEEEDVVREIQTDKQLYEGRRSDGSVIGPAYTPFTIRMKLKKGQPTDRVTLKDTGETYRTLQISAGEDSVEINFTTPQGRKLIEKYGEDGELLGLQRENLKEFIEDYFVPKLKERYDKIAES